MRNTKITFLTTHNKAALTIKIAAITLATLAVYHQDLLTIANEATKNELMSHILAIPFLFAYLIYRKRKMLKATIPFEETKPSRSNIHFIEIVGALLCLLTIIIYWHGSYTFYPLEYHIASLPLFIAGTILIVFNTQTLRTLAFPIAFLLFLIPLPIEAVYTAGTTLATFNSEAVYTILKTLGMPVSLTTQYGAPVILLESSEILPSAFAIDIACAGIYSLVSFTLFATFFAHIARGAVPKKLAIFFIGLPLIYGLNIIRITTIILVGAQYGIEAAMGVFHLFGGWALIFLGTLILLPFSEKILKIQIITTKSKPKPCSYCDRNLTGKQNFCLACGRLVKYQNIKISKRDMLKIAALLVSASIIMLYGVPILALTKGPEGVVITSGEQVSTQILPEIPGYTLLFIQRNTEFEEISGQDATLEYQYVASASPIIRVTLEIGSTLSAVHRPEISWIIWPQRMGRQPQAIQLDLRDVQLLQNPPITARFFAFEHPGYNQTQVMLYWYEQAIFETGSSLEQKYVKITLIVDTYNPQNFSKIENMLLPFGEAIANYWKPIKTWSKITLTIAQYGTALIATITTLLAVILILYKIKRLRQTKSSLQNFNRLALPEERAILKAAHQASQKGKSTGQAIASFHKKLSQEPIKFKTLLQKLKQAEEAGLIQREVASQEDNPILIWKINVNLPSY